MLNPDNEIGQAMLQFLTYSINNNIDGNININSQKIHDFMVDKLQKEKIISSTPLLLQKPEK